MAMELTWFPFLLEWIDICSFGCLIQMVKRELAKVVTPATLNEDDLQSEAIHLLAIKEMVPFLLLRHFLNGQTFYFATLT